MSRRTRYASLPTVPVVGVPVQTSTTAPEPSGPARMPRLFDPQLKHPGDVEYLSDTRNTASIINGATETLTFDFGVLRRRANTRWRLVAATGVFSGTGSGPYLVQNIRALGQELGHNFCVGRGVIAPVGALLPRFWDGSLLVDAVNRTGSAAACFVTLWIAPAGPVDPACGA